MELLYASLLLTFIVLFLSKLVGITYKPKTQKLRLPPGPWQLPIIGNIHNMLGSLPHHVLRDLARIHGPIMHLKLGEVSNIIISSPEAAREIMKTHDATFASRPLLEATQIVGYGGKGIIFAPFGEVWRQLRKVCVLELLSTRRVESFRSIREEEVHSLVTSISSSPEPVVNLTQLINSLMNDIIMRAVIGNKCADQATFLSAFDELVEVVGGFNLADLFPSSRILSFLTGSGRKLERIHKKLDCILDDIIQEHREKSGRPITDDFLDALLRLQEGADPHVSLTNDNVKAVILEIFAAGTETSTTTLGWAMVELVRNPMVMERVQSEIRGVLGEKGRLGEAEVNELNYLKLVIKETLRLHVPVPLLLPRECMSTSKILGYEIPEKARVMVNAWAIARDRQHWGEDAEEFRPERFEGSEIDYKGANFEFIPFGVGRRMCPGMSFGVANVEHTLAPLLCYFDWELPEGLRPSDLDMSERFGVTSRRTTDLYLKSTLHIPCPQI